LIVGSPASKTLGQLDPSTVTVMVVLLGRVLDSTVAFPERQTIGENS